MPRQSKLETDFWEAWNATEMRSSDLKGPHKVTLFINGEWKAKEFDAVSESGKLVVEFDGLGSYDVQRKVYKCARHQTPAGMRRDALERNAAVEAGWKVLYYPSSLMRSKPDLAAIVDQIGRVLCGLKTIR